MRSPDHWRAEVLIATTWACNLRCTYCFVQEEGLADASLRMSARMASHLVDALDAALPHIETVELHLYGGEPLTNLPAIKAMVRRARTKAPGRFTFSITTNGTLLSDEILAVLDEGLFTVVLSIDGPASVHDQCRRTTSGAPTHHLVLRFLEALRRQTRCSVRGSAVVRSGWSLAEASAYLNALPVSGVKAQVVRGAQGTPLALSEAERAAYLEDLASIGQQVIDDLEAGRAPKDDRYSSWVLQLLKGTPRTFYCGAGRTGFGITPVGEVLPCVLLDAETHHLGYIDDPEAEWVAAGLAWRKAFGRRSECSDCEVLFLCGGGCPAMLSVCGPAECEITRRECGISRHIYEHFSGSESALFPLAGVIWE